MVEYLGYLNQLKEGEAGVLTVSGSDESPTALRRRIGKAAQAAGKEIVIKRKDDAVYFWLRSGVRRRGRPRKGRRYQHLSIRSGSRGPEKANCTSYRSSVWFFQLDDIVLALVHDSLRKVRICV